MQNPFSKLQQALSGAYCQIPREMPVQIVAGHKVLNLDFRQLQSFEAFQQALTKCRIAQERPAFITMSQDPGPSFVSALATAQSMFDNGILDSLTPEHLLEYLYQGSSASGGNIALGSQLAKAMQQVLRHEQPNANNIYVCGDSGTELVIPLIKNGQAVTCELRSQSDLILTECAHILFGGDLNCHSSNPLIHPEQVSAGGLTKFPASMAFPAIGEKVPQSVIDADLFGRFPYKTKDSALLTINHLLAQTSGTVVVAVAKKLLFSPGAEKKFRQDITQSGHLRAVIEFPPGTLKSTSLPPVLLVFNNEIPSKQVRFINVSVLVEDKREYSDAVLAAIQNPKSRTGATLVDSSEIADNDYDWSVGRYVLSAEEQHRQNFLRSIETVELGGLVTFIRPPLSGKEQTETSAYEIVAADVPEFGPIRQPAKKIFIDDKRPYKPNQQLRPQDILLFVKGSVGKVGMVQSLPDDMPAVAGQSALVLRSTDPHQQAALYNYLRSNLGQAAFASSSTGVAIPMIRLADLKKIRIPLFTAQQAAEQQAQLDEEWALAAQAEEIRLQLKHTIENRWSINK